MSAQVGQLPFHPPGSWELVTAELAEAWLGRNRKNRNVTPRVVSAYADDMLAGKWLQTGEAIKFDVNHDMIDGQHRCKAILEAAKVQPDIAIWMYVIRGLPSDAQQVLDTGKKRSVADSLTLDGVPNAALTAASAKVAYIIEHGLLFRTSFTHVVTTAQIREWLEKNPSFVSFVGAVRQRMMVARVYASPSVTTTAFWEMARKDVDEASAFLDELYSLANLTENHPAMVLHRRLVSIRDNKQRMQDREYLALFFLAWNARAQNRTLTKFQRPRGGVWTATTFPWPK